MFKMQKTAKLARLSNILAAVSCGLVVISLRWITVYPVEETLLWFLGKVILYSIIFGIFFRYQAICLKTVEEEVQELIYKSKEY